MLKNYNTLWVFGDSFSTAHWCVNPQDSFWGLTAARLKVRQIKNCSWPGNSFDSILHNVVSLQNEYNWNDDLFLIGIPPLERLTVAHENVDQSSYIDTFHLPQWHHFKEEVIPHKGLKNIKFLDDNTITIYENRTWTVTQAMRNIFFLHTFLKSKNANYLIFNLAKDFDKDDNASQNNFLLEYCVNHPQNILFVDGYHSINLNINKPADFDQYGWYGHHGAAGNKYFFEKALWPTLEKNNLI